MVERKQQRSAVDIAATRHSALMLAFRSQLGYKCITFPRTESNRDGRSRTGIYPRWDKLWAKLAQAPKLTFNIMFLHDKFGNLPLRQRPRTFVSVPTTPRKHPQIPRVVSPKTYSLWHCAHFIRNHFGELWAPVSRGSMQG